MAFAASPPALSPLALPLESPIHVLLGTNPACTTPTSTLSRMPTHPLSLLVGAGAIGVVYTSRLHSPRNHIYCSAVLRSEYKPVLDRGGKFTILTKEFDGIDYDWEPHIIFDSGA